MGTEQKLIKVQNFNLKDHPSLRLHNKFRGIISNQRLYAYSKYTT